jgi:hypothetical protein
LSLFLLELSCLPALLKITATFPLFDQSLIHTGALQIVKKVVGVE